ncbi:MAG TPA: ABC transporter permease [Anaerolineae bacterium]
MREALRSFKMATWLGWQIESNWTDPFLFAIYSIAKPVSAALILVVMYSVVAQGGPGHPLFPYMYIGNAFYIYVGSVLIGISWAIIGDREEYGTLKYIVVAPLRLAWYLLGRGMARLIIGTLSVIITLAIGAWFLQVPISLATTNWPLFILAMILGLAGLMAGGLLLAGVSFLIARHAGFIGEAVAGALFLFTGAIFPLEVLPRALQPIGYILPVTHWLEAIRRAMLHTSASPTFAAWGDALVIGALVISTLMWCAIAVTYYRYAENRARALGLLDWQTQY